MYPGSLRQHVLKSDYSECDDSSDPNCVLLTAHNDEDECVTCGTTEYPCNKALEVVCENTELAEFSSDQAGSGLPETAVSENTGNKCVIRPRLARLQACQTTDNNGDPTCILEDVGLTNSGCEKDLNKLSWLEKDYTRGRSCPMALGGDSASWMDVNMVRERTEDAKGFQTVERAEVEVMCVDGQWETSHFRGVMPECEKDFFLAGKSECWLDNEANNNNAQPYYASITSVESLEECFLKATEEGYKSQCVPNIKFNPIIKDDETTYTMPCEKTVFQGFYPAVFEYSNAGSKYCRWWSIDQYQKVLHPDISGGGIAPNCQKKKYDGVNLRYCSVAWLERQTEDEAISTVALLAIIVILGGGIGLWYGGFLGGKKDDANGYTDVPQEEPVAQ